MVSLLKEQENFLRNAILTVDHSKEVFQCFIEQHMKNNHQTFEDFLNQNQHDIYHLYYDAKCCQCGPGLLQRKKRVLFASQMELLFEKNRQLSVHKITRHSDFCCCYAKKSVTTAVLDLTLARCLLMNCCIDMFWYSCLDFKSVTLEQFLNSNRHILYHLWKSNNKCCKCQPDFISPCNAPVIMENEWKKMFSATLPPCENDRKRPASGTISICVFAATPSITVQQIHIELQNIIIQYCCSTRKSVEKLAELRNSTFGHVKNTSMSCAEFNTFMGEAEDAILDLATVCGKEDYYRQRLLDLRDKPLDARMFRQYERVLLQTISNYEDIIKENEVLNDGIESLKNLNEEMKEKIENIEKLCILQTEGLKRKRLIDETSAEIEIHEKDVAYVEIEAVRYCIDLLESKNIVILSGREGSGKSRNGLEILRQVKEKSKDFDVFKLIGLTNVSDIVKSNVTSVVLFDDAFDKNCEQFSYDKHILDHLYSNITLNKVKLIFIMRNTMKHECKMLLSTHRLFHDLVNIDLDSVKFKLTMKEKEKIFTNYCAINKISLSERKKDYKDQLVSNEAERDDKEANQSLPDQAAVFLKREIMYEITETDPFLGFPECCRLFTENRNNTHLYAFCFKWPSTVLVNDIEKLRMEGINNYMNGLKYVILIHILTLSYSHEKCRGYYLKTDFSLVKRNIDAQECKQIFKICYNINVEVRTSDIEHVCEALTGRYLVYRDRTYYFQHQAIMDSVLISYSKINSKDIIPLLHFDHMDDLVRPHNYKEQDGEIVIKIPKPYYPEFAKTIITKYCYIDHSYRRLLESKIIMDNDIDLIYQFIFYIHNTKDSLPSSPDRDPISNYFPLYLLRNIGKLDDKLTVNHTKKNEMLISVIIGDKNITFSVDPWQSLCQAFYNKYRDIFKWLLQNTDHSLFDEILPWQYKSNIYSYLEYAQIMVENMENSSKNMTFLLKTLLIDPCIHALDWILDNVDNSLIDFDACLTNLDDYVKHDELRGIGNKLLLILKKVNHKWLDIDKILQIAINIHEINNENNSRFVHVTNKRIWHGVLELLLNHDSDSSINIDKTIKDVFDQFNHHGKCNEDEDNDEDTDEDNDEDTDEDNDEDTDEDNDEDTDEDNDEDTDEEYMKEIILLIMKQCSNKSRDSIMDIACRRGCHEIVEEGLSNKNDKITYYLDITLDELRRLESCPMPFYRDHGKIILLLLPMVNLKLIDLDSLMHDLCHIGHSLAILWLLEKNPSYPFDIRNVLNKACYHGDLKFVEYLLLKYKVKDLDYRTAMIKACRNSNGNTLDFCIWLWENNERGLFDMKASLNNASRCCNNRVVEWILTEVDKELFDTEAAVLYACEHGEDETVKLFFDTSSINMLDIQSAIIIACRNEKNGLSITKRLYERADQSTIDINAVFSVACKNYRSDIVQWIVKTFDQNITVTETSLDKNLVDMDRALTYILNMDAPDQKKENDNEAKNELVWLILTQCDPKAICIYELLTESCKQDWVGIFQWILRTVDNDGLNIGEVINVACKNGAFNIIQWSLENIDIQLVDVDNVMVESCGFGWLEFLILIWKHCCQYKLQEAMTEACTYGRLNIAEWLLKKVHYQHFDFPMLFQEAGRNGWINIFGWILQNFHLDKSDVHIATSQALENGHLDIAELVISKFGKIGFDFSSLLEKAYIGANKDGVVNFILLNIDPRSIDIATIMTNACLFGWKDVATFIVDNDLASLCDLSLALNTACDNGELEIVQHLLEKVDLDMLTTVDNAMHSVAIKGWDEIAFLLLDKFDHTRLDVGNALIEACRHGEIDIVQAILRKVERNMLDVKTALYKACENHMHEELVLWIFENIDQEQVDLKTVKKQAIRHKWRKVQLALTKVDTGNLNEFEQETETDNIIFLE